MKQFILIFAFCSLGNLVYGEGLANKLWETPIESWYRHEKKPWVVGDARHASFAFDGKHVAVSRTNKTVEILRISDQQADRIFDYSFLLEGKLGPSSALAFSPNRNFFAIAFARDRKVFIIDNRKQRILRRLDLKFAPTQLRFSPASRFLLVGDRINRHAWRAVYNLYKRKYFYTGTTAIVGDFSRDDRYFYRYARQGDEGRIIWMDANSLRIQRTIALSKLATNRPLHSIRVLRDHSIALGFHNTLLLTDRFLTRVTRSFFRPGLSIHMIEPSFDNRYLVVGDGKRQFFLRTHDGESFRLPLPDGARNIRFYPAGTYLLFSESNSGSTRIARLNIKQRTLE